MAALLATFERRETLSVQDVAGAEIMASTNPLGIDWSLPRHRGFTHVRLDRRDRVPDQLVFLTRAAPGARELATPVLHLAGGEFIRWRRA